MRIEYILLLILSVLPVMYKIGYWEYIFRRNKFSIRDTITFLKTKQGREYLFHFWMSLEIPLFFASFSIFYFTPLEILLFNAFFYLLILYNVFVIGKIIRKNIEYPSFSFINAGVTMCIFCSILWAVFLDQRFLYLAVSGALLYMPCYFMIVILGEGVHATNSDQEDHSEK